jgi:hypothetical protein
MEIDMLTEKNKIDMSLLYKDPKDVKISLEVNMSKGKIRLEFSSDCGKHGTDEMLAGYNLEYGRLLEILADQDDYTDDEL